MNMGNRNRSREQARADEILTLRPRFDAAVGRLKGIRDTAAIIGDLERQAAHDLRGAAEKAENMAEILTVADAGMKSGGLTGALAALMRLADARQAAEVGGRCAMNPLYITPHHAHTGFLAACQALDGLADCYPAVRFGMLKDGGRWLVFRIHEQHQQDTAFDAPDHAAPESVSDGQAAQACGGSV